MNVEKLAIDLLKVPIDALQPVYGGGNNKIYKIICASKNLYALKFYSINQHKADGARLEREYYGLSFLSQQGEDQVPKPFAIDKNNICGLYEWIHGEKITHISEQSLQQVLAFIKRLQLYSKHPKAQELAPAQDNALCISSVLKQIDRRMSRLQTANPPETLQTFLIDQFKPCQNRVFNWVIKNCSTINQELTYKTAVLSPSDFGFHNILCSNGKLIFIDFEYFGWEDPAAMLAHFLWHPGMQLSPSEKDFFKEGFVDLFTHDLEFNKRLRVIFPLIGLVWTLILLNEFIPAILQRRMASGAVSKDQLQKKWEMQLAKAKSYLNQVEICCS